MKGFINVLKSPGITSSTVVSVMKHILGMKKVGHAGTLDPAACGILPIMIGKATKLFDYLDCDGKEYISEFVFGIETDSIDMQGKVLSSDKCNITIENINNILDKFKGRIKQVPPRVSAISINGQKAYSMQRKGIDFDVPEKEVEVFDIIIIRETDKNKFLFKISCSKGTYIRSLCRDIAYQLGTVGYINYLIRIKSDYFALENAYTLEELKKTDISKLIIPIDKPINHLNRFDVNSNSKYKLSNGLKIISEYECNEVFRLYNNDNFFALAENVIHDNQRFIKIIKNFDD